MGTFPLKSTDSGFMKEMSLLSTTGKFTFKKYSLHSIHVNLETLINPLGARREILLFTHAMLVTRLCDSECSC